jgi:hypothetical protein
MRHSPFAQFERIGSKHKSKVVDMGLSGFGFNHGSPARQLARPDTNPHYSASDDLFSISAFANSRQDNYFALHP